MKIKILGLTIFFLLLTSLSVVLADPIEDIAHVNVQAIDAGGSILTGTFDYNFTINNEGSCTSELYTNFSELTTDSNGIISYYLDNIDPTIFQSQQLWIGEYRGHELLGCRRLAPVPYAYFAINTTTSGLIVDSNLSMGNFDVIANRFYGLLSWILDPIASIYFSFNGTTLTLDQEALNGTIDNRINITVDGNNASWTATFNSSYVPYTGADTNLDLGANNLSVNTDAIFVDSNNKRVGIGTTTPVAPLEIQSLAASMRQTRYSDTGVQSAGLTIQRSRGVVVGTDVVVQDGDRIANFNLRGYDGAAYRTAASIQAFIDGTPGSGDMPGRLIFLTTPDGSVIALERMRITNDGSVGIGTLTPNAKLQVFGNITANDWTNISHEFLYNQTDTIFFYNMTVIGAGITNNSEGINLSFSDIRSYNWENISGTFWYNQTDTIFFYNQTDTIFFYNMTVFDGGILNNTGGITLNFSRIFSNDWTNISLTKTQLENSGTLSFDWADGEVTNTLTIGALGSVDSTALTDGGTILFDWVDAEVADTLTIDASSSVADGALSSNICLLDTAQDHTAKEIFSAGINITGENNLTMGPTHTWWNGTCLNTEVSGTLVMSVGCIV